MDVYLKVGGRREALVDYQFIPLASFLSPSLKGLTIKGANNGNRKRGKISEAEDSFKTAEEAAAKID